MTREEILAQMRHASPWRTICEVHREIYDKCASLPEVQDLVLEAFVMAKKMDAKLRSHKEDWDAGFYTENNDQPADRVRRMA